ncbi:hypothetical protein JZ751_004503 [Albula glossodonta]|uniref:TLC domain-containing protein n=1 Tax=Albula glossodonta TaxID=121402 RepID=A0A8T2ML74_9TELE|nr:hypothetical protein JZ751_007517 [Albula glossodonta]KAG9335537.1 hypothetical protein JZ751_004503 [Albula glossodonta]
MYEWFTNQPGEAAAGGKTEDINQLYPSSSPGKAEILNTTVFESWEIIGPYPSWWLFNGLLLVLQTLHIFWSYLIARIAFKAIVRGKVSKDDRSDIESSSEEETETVKIKNKAAPNSVAASPKRENGTNGHFASGAWVQDHW